MQVLEDRRQEHSELHAELLASQTSHDELLRAYTETKKELDGLRSDNDDFRRESERAGVELRQGRDELTRARSEKELTTPSCLLPKRRTTSFVVPTRRLRRDLMMCALMC